MTITDGDDLEARLQRLEAAVFARAATPDHADHPTPVNGRTDDHSPGDDTFWALHGLEDRTAELEHGSVLFAGSVTVAAGPVQWQYARTTDDLLAIADQHATDEQASTERLARATSRLAAISSPVRLRLLLAVTNGTTTLAELGALDGIGTTGQVYHHVRVLTAAGWLQSSGRGRVAIPATRIVPLLTALAAME
ncbi:MAG TPA: winged helix-turn-helix domain-containing protein [Plantibacter sp.]|uniref:winged helix-turn-helix domain-containing protein n=1 Tax=unclassified Plantibacter TaxID=2624265 RepID=UPI002B8FDA39|nr:winged helix-turn-helix domain-containing protein [Plantibacter sp.]